MHGKIIRYIAVCASVILFFSSCVLKNSGKPGEAGSVSADSISESIEKPHIEKLNLLGDLIFVPDSGRTENVVFSNKETVLQVEDTSGLTWKLTIPSNALIKEETITMTPLKDVKGTNGGELSGVLLEPDGLKFIVPATLTVTGNGAKKGWFYSASQSGMNPELILTQQVDGGIESKITHFSSVVVDKSSPLSEPEKKAQIDAGVEKAITQVKEWLKDDPELPKPPTVKLECLTDENFEEALEYREKLFQEETAYLATLSIAYAAYKKAGDPMTEELKPLLEQLSERVQSRVIEFFEKYSPDPERYFLAASLLEDAATAFASGFLLSDGIDHSDMPIDHIFERLIDWGKHTMDYLIEQIRTKHHYKLVSAAYFVNEWLKISGINMLDSVIFLVMRSARLPLYSRFPPPVEGHHRLIVSCPKVFFSERVTAKCQTPNKNDCKQISVALRISDFIITSPLSKAKKG